MKKRYSLYLLIPILTLLVLFILWIVPKHDTSQSVYPIQGRNQVITATDTIHIQDKKTLSENKLNGISESPIKSTAQKIPGTVSIIHFGDAMFDRGVRKRMQLGTDVFSSIREQDILQDYDVRILNLEGPIVEMSRDLCQQKAYNFQFPIETSSLLKQEGFTHVTIANNHIFDCYTEGASSTLISLSTQNIQSFGYPKEQIATSTRVGDTTVTFIGYDNTIGHIPFIEIEKAIQQHRTTSDIILVSVHFGNEYESVAHPAQQQIAHRFIDLGADAVIGHHPHVIQNWEVYKGKPIFYSLGNFIFDQIGEKENFGFGVGLNVHAQTTDIMLYPYTITNSTPTLLPMQQANSWCKIYYGSIPYVNIQGCLATIEDKTQNTP